ncbi:MAG: phosphate ABC transporter, permease protein PstA, partial [Betaproteobacteria bacterium]|nr:phosphate ABC transporter, permease protein PstA [Betaproteobacteria bacterium]
MSRIRTAGRMRRQACMFGMLRVCAAINMAALVGICVFLALRGLPAFSWEFLTAAPRRMMTAGGIWPCIVGTLYLAMGAILVAFPLGVGTSVYLHEYAGRS